MGRQQNAKGRREGGTYFALPHRVMDSLNYKRLSSKAVKLLCDIGSQYNGHNNGDLCAAYTLMKPKGWASKSTLEEAIEELRHYGLILLTRQGGRNKPNLYALTWYAIDECKGKLDIAESKTPPGNWRIEQVVFVPRRKRLKRNYCPKNQGSETRKSGQSANIVNFRQNK